MLKFNSLKRLRSKQIYGQISSHEAGTLLESVPAPGTNFLPSIWVAMYKLPGIKPRPSPNPSPFYHSIN